MVSAGDTYAYDPATTFDEAKALWTTPPVRTFVAIDEGRGGEPLEETLRRVIREELRVG